MTRLAGVVVVGAAAAAIAWYLLAPDGAGDAPVVVAVLPFQLDSREYDDQAVSAVVHQAVIEGLADRTVVPWAQTANVHARGRALDGWARKLGVTHVVEMDLDRLTTSYAVGLAIVDARTWERIWSRRFTTPVADLNRLQAALTERITSDLAEGLGAVGPKIEERGTNG